MKRLFLLVAIAVTLSGCGKTGIGGAISQQFGDWAQIKLPDGCIPKQISAEESSGVAVLCEDGRVFH